MVDFTIDLTFLSCRRELRFPTIKGFSRDSEGTPPYKTGVYLFRSYAVGGLTSCSSVIYRRYALLPTPDKSGNYNKRHHQKVRREQRSLFLTEVRKSYYFYSSPYYMCYRLLSINIHKHNLPDRVLGSVDISSRLDYQEGAQAHNLRRGWVSQPFVSTSVGRFAKIDNLSESQVAQPVIIAYRRCRAMNLDLQSTVNSTYMVRDFRPVQGARSPRPYDCR